MYGPEACSECWGSGRAFTRPSRYCACLFGLELKQYEQPGLKPSGELISEDGEEAGSIESTPAQSVATNRVYRFIDPLELATYVNKSYLLHHSRGWTRTKIDNLLGKPDITRIPPRKRGAFPGRPDRPEGLYHRDRVFLAEDSAGFNGTWRRPSARCTTYRCSECGNEFRGWRTFQAHPCPSFSDYVVRIGTEPEQHRRSRVKARNVPEVKSRYQCCVCDRTFPDWNNLETHPCEEADSLARANGASVTAFGVPYWISGTSPSVCRIGAWYALRGWNLRKTFGAWRVEDPPELYRVPLLECCVTGELRFYPGKGTRGATVSTRTKSENGSNLD